MPNLLDERPENLNALRELVKEWLIRSVDAVRSFSDERGTFARDSVNPERTKTLTTPLRCYFALAVATRHLPQDLTRLSDKLVNVDPDLPLWWRTWPDRYRKYIERHPVTIVNNKFTKTLYETVNSGPSSRNVNNFELCRVAEHVYLRNYLLRFHGRDVLPTLTIEIDTLRDTLERNRSHPLLTYAVAGMAGVAAAARAAAMRSRA